MILFLLLLEKKIVAHNESAGRNNSTQVFIMNSGVGCFFCFNIVSGSWQVT
jgi:hypothetical protein